MSESKNKSSNYPFIPGFHPLAPVDDVDPPKPLERRIKTSPLVVAEQTPIKPKRQSLHTIAVKNDQAWMDSGGSKD